MQIQTETHDHFWRDFSVEYGFMPTIQVQKVVKVVEIAKYCGIYSRRKQKWVPASYHACKVRGKTDTFVQEK